MAAQLSDSSLVAGYKQTVRAIRQGRAVKVFIATDADPAIFETVKKTAEIAGIPAKETTMRELGRACGIDVPTSAAACVTLKGNYSISTKEREKIKSDFPHFDSKIGQ